jgi:hypothetical protein
MSARVCIFDGVDADDLTTMNECVAFCCAWAQERAVTVM